MTRVDSEGWIPKAKSRKECRDHQRNKFFREMGLAKGAQAQEIVGAPSQNAAIVSELLDLTAQSSLLEDAHAKSSIAMKAALTAIGLGQGEMGSVAETLVRLDEYSLRALRTDWFESPTFFDR